jgi:hypothetical protein
MFRASEIAETPFDAAQSDAKSPNASFQPPAALLTSDKVFDTSSEAEPGISRPKFIIKLLRIADPSAAKNPRSVTKTSSNGKSEARK